MKTIVISGARSHIGKTTLARQLLSILPDAAAVKIGHGQLKEGKSERLYPAGTSFDTIASEYARISYLIIESNSLLKEFSPDLAIYLEGNEQKPSAELARQKSDIISGKPLQTGMLAAIAARLDISEKIARKIAWLSAARPSPASAIILAGGKSRRMGTDKSRLVVGGMPVLVRLEKMLAPFFDELIVSASPGGHDTAGSMRIVEDTHEDRGPLMGITCALRESKTEINFVIACDIPDLHLPLLWQLLSESEDYDIAVPSFKKGLLEPLFGMYKRHVISEAQQLLDNGIRRVRALYDKYPTSIMPVHYNSWYTNLNTPRELKNYIRRQASGSSNRLIAQKEIA